MTTDPTGGRVIAWSNRSFSRQTGEILFARTADDGRTYTAPVRVSTASTVIAAQPDIAVDAQGTITILWTQFDLERGTQDVFASRSVDRGQMFSVPMNISMTNSTQLAAAQPAVGLDKNGNVYAVWTRAAFVARTQDIFYAVSTDGGKKFSDPLNISRGDQSSSLFADPAILVDAAGVINIVYIQFSLSTFFQEVVLTRSTDGGKSFSRPTNASNILRIDAYAVAPAVALDPAGNLAVIWTGIDEDKGEVDIYFARSTDQGRTFSTAINVSRTNSVGGLIVSGGSFSIDREGTIGVVWNDATQDNYEIFFSRSLDGGRTFSLPVNVSANQGLSAATRALSGGLFSEPPTIMATGAGQMAIAWDDDTGGVNRIMVLVGSVR
jgi:hypothetical protein